MPAVYLDAVRDGSYESSLDVCSWLRMTLAVCKHLTFTPTHQADKDRNTVLVLLVVGSLGSLLYMLSSVASHLPSPDEELEAGRIRLENGPVDERGRPVLAILTETPMPLQEGDRVPLRTWNICGGGMAF